jgi:hypothetical protein
MEGYEERIQGSAMFSEAVLDIHFREGRFHDRDFAWRGQS